MKKHQSLFLVLTLILLFLITPITSLAATTSSSSSATSSSVSSTSSSSSSQTGDTLQQVKQRGVLVVGMSCDYPPYEFTTKQNGKTKYVGFEVDLAKQFAKDLGVKLKIRNMDFDSLLVALETGKVDVVIAGLNATAQRKKSVNFSNIYYTGDNYFLINKSDKSKYSSVKDFKGKTIGAQNGTTQYTIVKNDISGAHVKGLAKLTQLVLALQSHKVDAVLCDAATARAYAANNSNLAAVKAKFSFHMPGTAMAFKKGDSSLLNAGNQTIKKVKQKDLINKKYLPQAASYMQTYHKNNTVASYWKYFAKGIEYTLIITIISVFFGFLLGILFALMRLSKNKLLHSIAVCYIEFIRGTPMMVQVMFVYFGIGAVIQSLPALTSGIIAVSINSGAYVAEIIRSGIQSVDHGQTEASRSLGMSKKQSFQYVILPQALKNIWPALGNEFITLLKDSSIVSVIGVGELMYQTQLVQSATYKGVLPLFITMIIYFILTFTTSNILHYFERKMNYDE